MEERSGHRWGEVITGPSAIDEWKSERAPLKPWKQHLKMLYNREGSYKFLFILWATVRAQSYRPTFRLNLQHIKTTEKHLNRILYNTFEDYLNVSLSFEPRRQLLVAKILQKYKIFTFLIIAQVLILTDQENGSQQTNLQINVQTGFLSLLISLSNRLQNNLFIEMGKINRFNISKKLMCKTKRMIKRQRHAANRTLQTFETEQKSSRN